MNLLPQNINNCPYLFLAPMEGVGDRPFRKAMSSIGGFDEASTEFLRVHTNVCIPTLSKQYIADELSPIPQAVQLMGSDPEQMACMAQAVEKRGAPRIDLNCGCPSNTVTGKGAGSSLLKKPEDLYLVAKAMVEAVAVPVTAKLRAGFADISLFKENLLAAQESGIAYLTLHARTKLDGYTAPARWELIAQAKEILDIPLVGNGDILTVQDALRMLEMTKCDALMIGRGAIINPFIFKEIKAHFAKTPFRYEFEQLKQFFDVFVSEMQTGYPLRTQINKLKQLAAFFVKGSPKLTEKRQQILGRTYASPSEFIDFFLPFLWINA